MERSPPTSPSSPASNPLDSGSRCRSRMDMFMSPAMPQSNSLFNRYPSLSPMRSPSIRSARLRGVGVIEGDLEEVLDVYFRECSFNVIRTDLAQMAAHLARGGVNPMAGRRVIDTVVVQRTLAVMVTCGMYDAAGDWVSAVGMPAKSGVGGGIVAVLPGQLGIGVYSPLLDDKGNSVRGVRVCRSLSQRLGLHFLTVTRESRSTRDIVKTCGSGSGVEGVCSWRWCWVAGS